MLPVKPVLQQVMLVLPVLVQPVLQQVQPEQLVLLYFQAFV